MMGDEMKAGGRVWRCAAVPVAAKNYFYFFSAMTNASLPSPQTGIAHSSVRPKISSFPIKAPPAASAGTVQVACLQL